MLEVIKIGDREVHNHGFVVGSMQDFVFDNFSLVATEGSPMTSWYYNATPPPFNPSDFPVPGPGCVSHTVVNGSNYVTINMLPVAKEKISRSTCHPSHILETTIPSVSTIAPSP